MTKKKKMDGVNQQKDKTDDKDLYVAEFERFCLKKRFPIVPSHIIQPVVEESIRSKK